MDKSVLATLAGAVLAALGYVAKQLADFLTAYVATKRGRQAQLLKLHSLLRAGRVIFEVQNDLSRDLERELRQNHPNEFSPELADAGFDEIFSHFYPQMNAKERNLHSVIRGQTINAMRTINIELSKWLADDGSDRQHKNPEARSLYPIFLRFWKSIYGSGTQNTIPG